MKKVYVKPSITMMGVDTQNIMAASGTGSDGISVSDPSGNSRPADKGSWAESKRYSVWED